MDATEARQFIELRLQPATDPALTDGEVAQLVTLAATSDINGNAPEDDRWESTYSIRGCWYAIAEGFMAKYSKAVGRFSFTTDGQTFTRNQTLDHLEHQRKRAIAKVQSCPALMRETEVWC